MGNWSVQIHQLEKAIEYSKLSIKISPENFVLLGNHAMNLLVAKFDEEAKDVIEKAILLNPEDKINRNIKQKIENVILKKERRPNFSDAIQ